MVHLIVDLELGMVLQVILDGGLGAIARAPGTIGEHVSGHVFNHRVEHHAVAADRSEGRVGFQLGHHVRAGMVAVQAHQHPPLGTGLRLDSGDNLGCDAGSLNHRDAPKHRVRLDRRAVVGADIDVHTQHFGILRAAAGGVQFQHGSGKDQRATVGYPGFHDEVGLD